MAYVLVVDDHMDAGETVAALLRKRGHRAIAVRNGRDALVYVTADTPDLIVLDLLMPAMDGVMFLEVVRSYLRLQKLPVLLMTAYPESPQVERAVKLGVLGVYRKGNDFNALLDAVEQHTSPPPTPPPPGSDRNATWGRQVS